MKWADPCLSLMALMLLLASQGCVGTANHPIRTFTFEDRGPEIARLYRLGLENDPKNVPAFCEALKSEDLSVRKAAIAQLVFTHDKSAFDAVAAAMKDESSWVRRGAISVLEKLGDRRAIPLLQEALTFVPPPPRRAPGPGQGRGAAGPPGVGGPPGMGAPSGMGPGSERRDGGERNSVLRQEEYFNRMAAALALHRLGSDAGAATVLEILRGQHTKPVLQMAVECVTVMNLRQATPDLVKLAGDCVAFGEDTPGFFAIRALRIMGDPAYAGQMVELAKQKMDCPGGFIRMEALNLLMLHGDESVMPAVRQAIGSSTWREHARPIVETIRRLRPSDGAALLVKNYLVAGEVDPDTGELTGRPNPHVFHFAVAAVAELGDKSVLEDLKASYKRFSEPRDNFNYRLDLAYAMAALGDGFGLDELHRALGHGDAAVRRLAAKSLGKLGSPASLAPLTAAFAAEGDKPTFLAMRAALAKLGAPAQMLARPMPPLPPAPADADRKPRYLHVTFDDCTTIGSLERFVGLMEELASKDVRWAPGMYVAALSRHDFEYATMMLQRCFDRGCEIENHSLHHNPDGQAVTARTADDVRLDCGGCTNWLHANIMGCDRIYSWKSGGGGFRRPGDPTLSREELREVTREAFWAKNIDYSWRAVEKAYPDYFAPPYHFLGQSPVESCRVSGDLSYDYEADTVEEGVSAFVESLDAWYFSRPQTVFELSGHDWPNSPVPIRIGHEMHWDILSGSLREVLLNRRDRYPQLYSMTALEVLHINQRGLTPEEVLTQTVHLQNSPDF